MFFIIRTINCSTHKTVLKPMPFRQHLLYVIGRPIFPPSLVENKQDINVIVDEMHQKFIVELVRIFNKYKHSYGWGHKRIVLK